MSKSKRLVSLLISLLVLSCGSQQITSQTVQVDIPSSEPTKVIDNTITGNNNVIQNGNNNTIINNTGTPTDNVIKVESVSVFPQSLSLNVGEDKPLTATVTFNNGSTESDVIYSVDDTSIVKVDEDGKFIGLKEGKAIITVVSKKDTKKSTNIPVIVNPRGTKEVDKKQAPIIITSIVISPSLLNLKVGEDANFGQIAWKKFFMPKQPNQDVPV